MPDGLFIVPSEISNLPSFIDRINMVVKYCNIARDSITNDL